MVVVVVVLLQVLLLLLFLLLLPLTMSLELELLMSLKLQPPPHPPVPHQRTPVGPVIAVTAASPVHATICRNNAARPHPNSEAPRVRTPSPAPAIQPATDAQYTPRNHPEISANSRCSRHGHPAEHDAPGAAPSHVCRRRPRPRPHQGVRVVPSSRRGRAAAYTGRQRAAAAAHRCRRRGRARRRVGQGNHLMVGLVLVVMRCGRRRRRRRRQRVHDKERTPPDAVGCGSVRELQRSLGRRRYSEPLSSPSSGPLLAETTTRTPHARHVCGGLTRGRRRRCFC